MALYAILKAAGIGMGDSNTSGIYLCCCANAIIYTGATPVYVDVDFDSFNANMQNIEEQLPQIPKQLYVKIHLD